MCRVVLSTLYFVLLLCTYNTPGPTGEGSRTMKNLSSSSKLVKVYQLVFVVFLSASYCSGVDFIFSKKNFIVFELLVIKKLRVLLKWLDSCMF